MRIALSVGALALALSAFAAAPSVAQDGPTMWCYADAGNGAETTRYYSAFFSAGAHQAEVKARAFKSEADDEEISAVSITAKCVASPNYDAAVASRNAEMAKTKGTVLSWAG